MDGSLTVSPIRNAAGEIIRGSKVGRDVTEAQQMSLLTDRLAAIVESFDDIMVAKSLDGIIMGWNKGAERILGSQCEGGNCKRNSMLMPPTRKFNVWSS